MRVIEPHHFKHSNKKKIKKIQLIKLFVVLIVVLLISYLRVWQPSRKQIYQSTKNNDEIAESKSTVIKNYKLKIMTGEQFKNIYSTFVYPNTRALVERPETTGNTIADKIIWQIAEKRGYKLSSVPVSNIIKINEPLLTSDDLMQQNANIAWQSLKKAAEKDKIPLQLTSAYRSIEFQRNIFMRRLADEGISVNGIADGYSNIALERILSKMAPPGYSRHHTGYTMDFACDGIGLDAFTNTSCYKWLSNNNFEQTKKRGLVPSYPKGVSTQGPEPEAWEFIWVGTSQLYELTIDN